MGWAGLSWAVVEEVFEPVVRIRADERAERGCAGSLVSQTVQAAIRLGEEWRPVLVLRSATILPCGSRHRGQKGVHLYSRPPTSSKVWRSRSREQSAGVQVPQFAQEFTECRRISAVGASPNI